MLREDGGIVDAHGGVSAAGREDGDLLVSRALCRFRFMPRLPQVTPSAALAAARLHAEGHAPFSNADHVIYRARSGFAIWWWDADRVRPGEGPARRRLETCMPESVAFATVDGWRQVRTAEGFEAQYAEGGVLRASLWRRRPFTDEQWRVFAQGVDAPTIAAPDAAPAPVAPDRRSDLGWRMARVSEAGPWRSAERALWAVTAVALLASAGIGAHWMRYADLVAAETATAATLRAAMKEAPQTAATSANLALVAAASKHAPAPEHVIAVADVVTAMRAAGGEPVAIRSDGASLRVVGAGGAVEAENLAVMLEDNPRLRDVAPTRRAGGIEVLARIERSGASLADGASP